MTKTQIRKNAFLKSIPIMCSYIFVSMAYGLMMENAGFGWYYLLFVSLTVYAGTFQFVLTVYCLGDVGSDLRGIAFPKGIAAVRSVENAVR